MGSQFMCGKVVGAVHRGQELGLAIRSWVVHKKL